MNNYPTKRVRDGGGRENIGRDVNCDIKRFFSSFESTTINRPLYTDGVLHLYSNYVYINARVFALKKKINKHANVHN